ncbi:MAG: LysR family transcriptional regulator [Erysipelotrichaceae bacterium]|nr:LysR family transcriptional regulator [Erysipelotrichaceae bacterium]
MDLRVIEYFLAVAEEGNISHAAERLHVSQPTVSRQLMDLEIELNKKLFERTNKKVILTEDGMQFRETANDILRLYEKAKSSFSEESELAGDLYIAAAEIESFSVLSEKIKQFHDLYPSVVFHIHSGNAEEILSRIDKGTADLGWIVRSSDTSRFEVHDMNINERWGILVRSDHPLSAYSCVSAEDIENEKLIIPENSRLRSDLREWIGTHQHIAAEYTLVKNAMILTAESDWVTICLETDRYIDRNLVFIPLEPVHTSSVSLIWKKRTVYPAHVRKFLEFLDIQILN